jgi:hypothetical protein
LSPATTLANEALRAFDLEAQPRHLRRAMEAVLSVDLLVPGDPSERLSRRGEVLNLWLAIMTRLDGLNEQLVSPVKDDKRSAGERNQLGWQCDALAQELTDHASRFLQLYYTDAPADRAELKHALEAAGLTVQRRTTLFP